MKTVILGGGISGLSAAWFLKKRVPHAQITLLEKEAQLGGVLLHGPRTFPYRRDSKLLALVEELGLEVVRSFPSARRRFIWEKGKLRSIGSMIPWLVCLRSLFRKRFQGEDCTVYDFAKRRFNEEIAETVFDPMVLGIYAGDLRQLSLKSCFPKMYEWDIGKGSLFSGLLISGSKGLFTVKGGMSSLVQEMERRLSIDIVLGCSVEKIGDKEVEAGGKIWKADQIISALPMHELNRLTGAFEGIEAVSLQVVELSYPHFHREGLGYLIPTREKESIFGAIWDSSIFPQKQGQVSVFLRGDELDPVGVAQEALSRHLGLGTPLDKRVWRFPNAIPQFGLGFSERKIVESERLLKKYPGLSLIGNYWQGASVDACIQQAASSVSN